MAEEPQVSSYRGGGTFLYFLYGGQGVDGLLARSGTPNGCAAHRHAERVY
jgi:hypothetical protein